MACQWEVKDRTTTHLPGLPKRGWEVGEPGKKGGRETAFSSKAGLLQ